MVLGVPVPTENGIIYESNPDKRGIVISADGIRVNGKRASALREPKRLLEDLRLEIRNSRISEVPDTENNKGHGRLFRLFR